jgi:hypothetical protein
VKPFVLAAYSFPHHGFIHLTTYLSSLKTSKEHVFSLETKNPIVSIEESSLIPLVRYQMYYKEQKKEVYHQFSIEQQNVENQNTINDTFIDRNKCSLAYSRGKPPT